ncbi:MAG: hypothetical protein WCA98_08990 [Candidatus Acidiferrales bacterium]
MAIEAARDDFYLRVETRIGRLTLALGFAAALAAGMLIGLRAGAGVAVGTLLAWLNFRWLDQATGMLVRVASEAPETVEKHVPFLVGLKLIGRYGLIAVVAYVMVVAFGLPISSILGGLLALGAAAMGASLYTVIFENN